jgi:hypothetical protein
MEDVMFGFAKIAVLGAALSVGAATAYDLPMRKLEAAVGGKYQDRVLPSAEGAGFSRASVEITGSVGSLTRPGKGDRLAPAQAGGRASTVERRVGTNVSVLTRVAPATIATR